MAQLGNLLVTGSSRLLGKLFCNDLSVGNSLSVKILNATNFTATSITTSGLTVNGNATTTGTLNVGNSQANGKISINGKVSIRDYANNGWLGINDTLAWTNGVYFGKTTVRTDGIFQVGDAGNKVLFNQSSAKFTVPVTINNSLAANNITATNVTVNDTLKAFKYELNTIQDLGGEFCVAPTIYIQSGATVNVSKASSTTITVSILDKTAITSDSIQGVRWAQNSKIKFQGKIDGLNIRCSGIMAAKLNTTVNTMSLTLTVESAIADHFATAKNGVSYSDISVMLYQRYGKKIGSTIENVYSPVGIRMSATGNANSAPYVDIWGNKSNSDPDTVYTVPSVRLGYLDGLSTTLNGTTVNCVGYGLYADNVYLNGTIMSQSGSIGGFKIDNNSLVNGNWGVDNSVMICTGTSGSKAIGGSDTINGWCFSAGSKFGVTKNGNVYATGGKIGGFTISDYNLKGNNIGLGASDGHDYAFWAGADTGANAPFRVGYDGSFVATKATIDGEINATSGIIGGFEINGNKMYNGGNASGYIVLDGNSTTHGTSTIVMSAGGTDTNHTDAKYKLYSNGHCEMSDIKVISGTIGGWDIHDNCLSSYGFKYVPTNDDTRTRVVETTFNPYSPIPIMVNAYDPNDLGNSQWIWSINTNNLTVKADFSYTIDNLYVEGDIKVGGNYYRNGYIIGEEISSNITTTNSLSNNTWSKTGAVIDLQPGVYVITGWIYFAKASSGKRGIRFINQNNNFIVDSQHVIVTNNDEIMLNTMSTFTATYDVTISLQGLQNSGASLNIKRSILKAVRIA